MENVKFYTLDEVKDKHIGKIGTPQREKYEAELQSFSAKVRGSLLDALYISSDA